MLTIKCNNCLHYGVCDSDNVCDNFAPIYYGEGLIVSEEYLNNSRDEFREEFAEYLELFYHEQ